MTYAGEDQQLVDFASDKNPEEGCIQYQARVGSSGQWHSSPGSVTGKDAGTYTVNV